jgi:PAS domain-containing protein
MTRAVSWFRVDRPTRNSIVASADEPQQLLALVEAQTGSLLELLPVALMVTSASGQILRVNSAATELLECDSDVTGLGVDAVLANRDLAVRVRVLRHKTESIRLYVLQPIARRR